MRGDLIKINLSSLSPGWDYIHGLFGLLTEPILQDKNYTYKIIIVSKNFLFEEFYLSRDEFEII